MTHHWIKYSAARIALAVLVAATAVGFNAEAQPQRRDNNRRDEPRNQHDNRRNNQRYEHYDRGPPVIYGRPYGYQPPLVYGPSLGLFFNLR